MVFFTCNSCGASLKKANVQVHVYQCSSRVREGLSCQDCCQNFTLGNYNAHVSCITETQRYGDATQRSQVPKSQMQQKKLLESLVTMRTNPELSRDVKRVLNHLSTMNIPGLPTKEKKLKNLLRNVIAVTDNTFAQLMVLVNKILGSPASESSSHPTSLQNGVNSVPDAPVKKDEAPKSRKINEENITVEVKRSPSTDESTPKSEKKNKKQKLAEEEANLEIPSEEKTDVSQKKSKKNKLEKNGAEKLNASLFEGEEMTSQSRKKNKRQKQNISQEEQVEMSPSFEESTSKLEKKNKKRKLAEDEKTVKSEENNLIDEDGPLKMLSISEEYTAKSGKKSKRKKQGEKGINTEGEPESSFREEDKILQNTPNSEKKRCKRKVSMEGENCPENTQTDRQKENEGQSAISEDQTQISLINGESNEHKYNSSTSKMAEQKINDKKKRKSKNFGNYSSFITSPEKVVNGCLAEESKSTHLQNGGPLVRDKIDFKWKSSVRNALCSQEDCRMKLRKLEKQVLAEYLSAGGEDEESGKALFMKTLQKAIFVVDDKYVQLKRED